MSCCFDADVWVIGHEVAQEIKAKYNYDSLISQIKRKLGIYNRNQQFKMQLEIQAETLKRLAQKRARGGKTWTS